MSENEYIFDDKNFFESPKKFFDYVRNLNNDKDTEKIKMFEKNFPIYITANLQIINSGVKKEKYHFGFKDIVSGNKFVDEYFKKPLGYSRYETCFYDMKDFFLMNNNIWIQKGLNDTEWIVKFPKNVKEKDCIEFVSFRFNEFNELKEVVNQLLAGKSKSVDLVLCEIKMKVEKYSKLVDNLVYTCEKTVYNENVKEPYLCFSVSGRSIENVKHNKHVRVRSKIIEYLYRNNKEELKCMNAIDDRFKKEIDYNKEVFWKIFKDLCTPKVTNEISVEKEVKTENEIEKLRNKLFYYQNRLDFIFKKEWVGKTIFIENESVKREEEASINCFKVRVGYENTSFPSGIYHLIVGEEEKPIFETRYNYDLKKLTVFLKRRFCDDSITIQEEIKIDRVYTVKINKKEREVVLKRKTKPSEFDTKESEREIKMIENELDFESKKVDLKKNPKYFKNYVVFAEGEVKMSSISSVECLNYYDIDDTAYIGFVGEKDSEKKEEILLTEDFKGNQKGKRFLSIMRKNQNG